MVIHKSEKEKNTEIILLTENYSLVTIDFGESPRF